MLDYVRIIFLIVPICFEWNGKTFKGQGPCQPNGPGDERSANYPQLTECGLQHCEEVQRSQCESVPQPEKCPG